MLEGIASNTESSKIVFLVQKDLIKQAFEDTINKNKANKDINVSNLISLKEDILKMIDKLISLGSSIPETTEEEFGLYNITVGQIKDGLDSFYSNYANRRIKLIDAIYIVRMQIKGKSPELIEAQTRYLRMMPDVFSKELDNFSKIEDYYFSKEKRKDALLKGKITKEDFLRAGYFVDESGELIKLFRYGKYN